MDLKEKAEQTERDIAQLKESRENAERALAALKDKHERTEGENLVRELDHLQYQRKLESVTDFHEMELAKQKDLVEALNQDWKIRIMSCHLSAPDILRILLL